MILEAISIGDAFPRTDFEAVVHSVFRPAIYLCPSNGSELLTLVTSSEADLPQGIRVDTPKDFSFEIFSAGEPITCRNENLRINSLTVELHGIRRWKCNLPALQADATKPGVSAALELVWDVLNKRQIQMKAEIIAENLFCADVSAQPGVAGKTGNAIRTLFKASQNCDLSSITPVRALIGLGSGLTPGGDDLLVGYLAGLWCAVQGKNERVQYVSDLGKAIIHYSRQTNDISRTYLYHAARGQVSSSLANLAEAICMGGNTGRLLEVAETTMRVGHTSGMDAVAGLLIGLTAWIEPGDPNK
jgi:hypothetical protein